MASFRAKCTPDPTDVPAIRLSSLSPSIPIADQQPTEIVDERLKFRNRDGLLQPFRSATDLHVRQDEGKRDRIDSRVLPIGVDTASRRSVARRIDDV